jgi:CelD/BcsL family acetyltransferase involved in cellulose biosynthesis
MTPASQAAFDARHGIDTDAAAEWRGVPVPAKHDLKISIAGELAPVEADWRALEAVADCTAFQTFDWVSAWHRNIGIRSGVKPAVVTVRDAAGALLLLLPLAIEPGKVRRLTWLASDLCDYNAPLLAPDFSRRVAGRFEELWCEIVARLQSHPDYRYDLIQLEKMPEQVGAQANPMLGFTVVLNPSNAYATRLAGDWETFYAAKRSSATRRGDRRKRKRLGEFGEVKFVSTTAADIGVSFGTLMRQKTAQFARMGVPNIFARPGYPEFFLDVAGRRPDIVHVSRLDVGATAAAVNYGLMFRGRYYHVLASYTDHPMSKFGPGAAHLNDLLAHAIGRGCDTFDFTIGDEGYKRDWCDGETKLYDHIAIATARGAVVAGPLVLMRAVKRWIKQTPAIWNAVTRMRALTAALRKRSAEDKSAD